MDNGDNVQQENNQLLFNAVQQKFASKNAGNSEGKCFKSSQLTIPALRAPTSTNASDFLCSETPASNSPLNKFLINQLRQNKINGLNEGFKLPELKVPTTEGTSSNEQKLNIPLLNRLSQGLTPQVNNIETGVRDLSINTDKEAHKAEPSSPLIDLTTALIANIVAEERPTASKIRQTRVADQTGQKEFDIPYIGCNEIQRKQHLNYVADEYCIMNIANVQFNHNLANPSGLGSAVCVKDKFSSMKCFQCAATAQEKLHLKIYRHIKHGSKIERFRFDTKSPDDVVKASLNKYQRVS